MFSRRIYLLGIIVFLSLPALIVVPVSVCAEGAPPPTPVPGRITPPEIRGVNPHPAPEEGVLSEIETSGSVEQLPVGVTVSTEAPVYLELAPQTSGSIPSVSTALGVPLRFQPASDIDVSCGVQALGMVMDFQALATGDETPTSAEMLSQLGANGLLYDHGTGVEELAYLARQNGYAGSYSFHNWNLSKLQEELQAGRPVVVSLGINGENTPGHFVTVTGVSEDGQWVSYNDPALGKMTVPAEQFMEEWGHQGHSGMVTQREALATENDPMLPVMGVFSALSALMVLASQQPWRKDIAAKITAMQDVLADPERLGVGGRRRRRPSRRRPPRRRSPRRSPPRRSPRRRSNSRAAARRRAAAQAAARRRAALAAKLKAEREARLKAAEEARRRAQEEAAFRAALASWKELDMAEVAQAIKAQALAEATGIHPTFDQICDPSSPHYDAGKCMVQNQLQLDAARLAAIEHGHHPYTLEPQSGINLLPYPNTGCALGMTFNEWEGCYVSQGPRTNDCGPSNTAMMLIATTSKNWDTSALNVPFRFPDFPDWIDRGIEGTISVINKFRSENPIFFKPDDVAGATHPAGLVNEFNAKAELYTIPLEAKLISNGTKDQLVNEIQNGNPVTVIKVYPNGVAHYVTAISCDATTDTIYYMDPDPSLNLPGKPKVQSQSWSNFDAEWSQRVWWSKLLGLQNEMIVYHPKP